MSIIRLAVIGVGGMGTNQGNLFSRDPEVRIAACCDTRKENLAAFAKKFSVPASYTDYREMLDKEKIDAVTVVTRDEAHCEVAVAALKKGLHVLCEKPMATTLVEARRMLRAAQASGKTHMVNFSYRTMPSLERARQMVQEGRLGRIMHVEASYLQSWLAADMWGDWREKEAFLWRMTRKHRGGALVDIGCHILMFSTAVVGQVEEISCTTKSFDKGVPRNTWKGYKLDADDSFCATAQFETGALGVVHATRWAPGHANVLRLRVFGDKGALTIDSEAGRDKLSVCIGDFHVKNLLWNEVTVAEKERDVYTRFLAAVRTGQPETPTFEDGYRIQAYMEAMEHSAVTGQRTKVKR